MMRLHSRSAVLALALLVVAGHSAQAGPLVNGDFSNGLNGWTVNGDTTVSVVGTSAVIGESSFAQEVDLLQTFTLPANAHTLSFKVFGTAADTPPSSGPTPDSFGASLLNSSTFSAIVPTVDINTDSFYTRDLAASQGQTAPGASVSSDNTFPILVTLDVSSVAGQDVQLLFRLLSGSDSSSSSSVSIGAVTVDGGALPTPEPTSVALLGLGLVGLAWRSARLRMK